MNLRLLPAGAAAGFLTMIAVGPMPAAATPCTNLKFLQLQQSTITSATDTTLPGVPAFCRVTGTLKPTSDSTIKIEVWLPKTIWNGRFLGIGGGGVPGPGSNRT